jgi:hypothetical protein
MAQPCSDTTYDKHIQYVGRIYLALNAPAAATEEEGGQAIKSGIRKFSDAKRAAEGEKGQFVARQLQLANSIYVPRRKQIGQSQLPT